MERNNSESLNEQINKELNTAYHYLEFSNYFDSIDLKGYGQYFAKLAKKKISIAMLMYAYIHKQNQPDSIVSLFSCNGNLEKILKMLKFSLDSEIDIQNNLNTIYTVALQDKDYETAEFTRSLISLKKQHKKLASDMLKDFTSFDNPKQLDDKYLQN